MFAGAAHSRLVVYNDTLDDPIGMVHIRDLIGFMAARAALDPAAATANASQRCRPVSILRDIDLSMPLTVAKIVREILFVPPSMPALDLLAKMQATRIHLALVIDEYGGTDGLVSIEDLVELIVGDIADEHDEDETPAVVAPARRLVPRRRAREPRRRHAPRSAPNSTSATRREEVDTLGGYLMTRVGRLPVRGELVPGPAGFEIEVLDADPRRVKKVRIHRSKDRRPERGRDGRRDALRP